MLNHNLSFVNVWFVYLLMLGSCYTAVFQVVDCKCESAISLSFHLYLICLQLKG